ncbi:MAG TPA: Maf family protein, partial [Ramlibacter sp.]
MPPLILASTSPRRKELLALLQVPFEMVEPNYHEWTLAEVPPEAQARTFALEKARSCMWRHPDSLVVGSDTLIALGTMNLGKPADRAQANAMLRRLRGREHRICSAVAVCGGARQIEDVALDIVQVWMKPFSDADLE